MTFIVFVLFSSCFLPYDFGIAASRELGVQGVITFLFSKHWLAGGLLSYFMNYGEVTSSIASDAITGKKFFISSIICLVCAALNYLGARCMLTTYDDELYCSFAGVKRSLLAISMFSLLMTSSFFVIEAHKSPDLEISTLIKKFSIILFVSLEIRIYILVYRYFKRRREVAIELEKT